MKKDYYEILGVSKDADEKTIKMQHRKLIKKYHPDISKEPDAEVRFKEIQEAYEVLSDEEKRAKYDQYGHAAFEQQSRSGYYRETMNAKVVNFKDFTPMQKIMAIFAIIALVVVIVLATIISVIFSIIRYIISLFTKRG